MAEWITFDAMRAGSVFTEHDLLDHFVKNNSCCYPEQGHTEQVARDAGEISFITTGEGYRLYKVEVRVTEVEA